MADEATIDETVSEDTESTQEVQDQDTDASSEDEAQSKDDLPDWAKKQLENARREAARYRTKAKEAHENGRSEALSEAQESYNKLQESYETQVYRTAEAELQVKKMRAALDVGISADKVSDFADRIRGEDEESIAEDAKSLASTFGIDNTPTERKPDYSQGAGNTALNGDPLLDSLRNKLGIN